MLKTRVLYLLLLFVVAEVASDLHYYEDCVNPGTDPVLFYYQEISKSGHLLAYQEETIRIPETGFTTQPITCISVINLLSDEEGGYPYVRAGGVTFNYVVLYFKSQLNLGYDFRASVYYNNTVTTTEATIITPYTHTK